MDITEFYNRVMDNAVRCHYPEAAISELHCLRARCDLTYCLMAEMVKSHLKQASEQGVDEFYAALNNLGKFMNSAPYLTIHNDADLKNYTALDPEMKKSLEYLYQRNPETFAETFDALVNGIAEESAKNKPITFVREAAKAAERSKGKWGKVTGAIVAAVALGAGIGYLWHRHQQKKRHPPQDSTDTWAERMAAGASDASFTVHR